MAQIYQLSDEHDNSSHIVLKISTLSNIRGHRVIRVIKTGSSRPMVVEDDRGDRYMVKMRESLSNPNASVSDFICCKLGMALGLPVIDPVWMLIEPGIDWRNVDDEMQDTIAKSYGYNIAYPFFENAADIKAPEITPGEPPWRELFLFDLLMLNIDRTLHNLNLIRANGRLYSFDYETSMLVTGCLQGKSFHEHPAIIQQIRQNPLYYSNISPDQLQTMQAQLAQTDISGLLAQFPPGWLPQWEIQVTLLHARLSRDWQDETRYLPLLERLHTFVPEPEEARKARILQNREAFEQRFKP